jgi:LysR family transcriptional regulator, nitrogen assimilation regulatory protein
MERPVDFRQLRYFAEIATNANFNRAAERLRIAQPALSRQMRKLEEELGIALFTRVGRGVALTRAGEVLAEHSRFLLKQLERTREAVVAEATVPQGSASLGAPPSIGYALFGPIAEQYTNLFPRVTLRLVEGMTHNLVEMLRAGQIDLAIVTLPEPRNPAGLDKDLAVARTFSEDMMLFGPGSDSRLKPQSSMSELSRLPLILTSRPNMARLVMENAARTEGVGMNVRLEVESLHVMKELVARGMGYGVVPAIGLYGQNDCFAVSVIAGLKLVRAVAYRAGRPPSIAVSELLRVLDQTLDELSDRGAFNVAMMHPRRKRSNANRVSRNSIARKRDARR